MLSTPTKYRTSDISSEDSVTAWTDYLAKTYYGHLVEPGPSGQISGEIERRQFADVGVSRHFANAHRIARTPALIASDRAEQHAFALVTSGHLRCQQQGRSIFVERGGMYILNASEPFDIFLADNTATAAITMPSDVCRQFIAAVDDKCCRSSVADGLLTTALIGLMNGFFGTETQVDAFWLRDVLCDLLDAVFNPRYSDASRGSWMTSEAARGLLLKRARQVIAEYAHRQDFNVAKAAEACGVSPRHLQNVLKSAGTTFTNDLIAARLVRASEILRSPSRGFKQLGQIARECGFKNQSHFSTRYKDRFGHSPKQEILRTA